MRGYSKILSGKFVRPRLLSFHFTLAGLEGNYRLALLLPAIAAAMYACVGIFYNVLCMRLLKPVFVARPHDSYTVAAAPWKHPADFYAVIPHRNLFGSTDKNVFENKPDGALSVEADISFVLEVRGTVAGMGKDGFAVIEDRGKNKQALYKVGEVVAGAKIVSIARNTVTFQVGGKKKVLKMAETKEAPILPPYRNLIQATASGESERVLDINNMSASLKDMGAMLSQAQVKLNYSEGVPDGFIITDIKPNSIYGKMGLLEGDIIQGVDDRRLTTADDVTALYNSMKSGTSFTLKIKRRGREESLRYVFR
jgi:general secretion pathway protein C